MHQRLTALASLLVALFTPALAAAQLYRNGPPPQHRIVYRDLTALRGNPLGLITDARIAYRFRLYESESLALRDNFVSVGLAPSFSPAFARGGPIVELQPLSVLQVWAMYEVVAYAGAFDFLQSFGSAHDNFGGTEISRRADLPTGDPLRHYSTTGTQLVLGANLQVKVKDIVARTQLRAGRPDFSLRGDDRVFYDIVNDLLTPNRSWWGNADTDLLYQHGSGLTLGLRWTVSRSWFDERHFRPGETISANPPGTLHRAGPMAAYTFMKEDGASFEPTVMLVLNWWIAHPYRTGAEVHRAIPYAVVAFAMTGDLLSKAEVSPVR